MGRAGLGETGSYFGHAKMEILFGHPSGGMDYGKIRAGLILQERV